MTSSSLATSYYDETVTLYRTSGLDDNNDPEYTTSSIRCRLDRKENRVQDASGYQVVCNHVMLCDEAINPVTDYIVTAALEKLIPKLVLNPRDFGVGYYEVYLA
jgi:hypothetical protein